jgi:hypothetical protein
MARGNKSSRQPPAPQPSRGLQAPHCTVEPPTNHPPSPGEEFDFGDLNEPSTDDEQPARGRPPSLASVELTAGSAAPMRPASPSHPAPIVPGPRTNSTATLDIPHFFKHGVKGQGTKTICRLCRYTLSLHTVMALLTQNATSREKHTSSPNPPRYEFSLSSSNTTLRGHLQREHKDDYIHVCQGKGWKNQLLSTKFESEAGSEPSAGAGRFRTAFSSKAFMEHLINFIVADDQVSKLCLYCLPG